MLDWSIYLVVFDGFPPGPAKAMPACSRITAASRCFERLQFMYKGVFLAAKLFHVRTSDRRLYRSFPKGTLYFRYFLFLLPTADQWAAPVVSLPCTHHSISAPAAGLTQMSC